MRRWMLLAGLAATMAARPTVVAVQSNPVVSVRCFRFYRAEQQRTLVTAFVEVPYALLEPPSDAAHGDLRYGVTVQITDPNGKQLEGQSWPGRARADLRSAGAVAFEMLDFSLEPGISRIEVTVTDSVSGKRFIAATNVTAWSEAPGASDLMLSPNMRVATGSDTMPKSGERRWGNTLATAVTELRLSPVRPKAFYLLEAYSATADSGTMQVRVTDSSGTALVTTRATAIRVAAGGSVLKGALDLTGLPSGKYTMTVRLDVGGTIQERADQFVMADFNETMQREESRLASLRESDEGYFGLLNEDQLQEAFAPLIYLAPPESLSVWKSGLTIRAKREFLTRFWTGRDPTPATPRNEHREVFYSQIAEANKLYAEGSRSTTPGWRTDRGRIFVKYGKPADALDRLTSVGTAPPYQVWRYDRGKQLYYVFTDRGGTGAYKLLVTNDLKEASLGGYADILGSGALQDISRWLGIDLFNAGPRS